MQKVTPNLWFKGNAEEAVNFYLSAFPDGKIITTSYYPNEGLLDFQEPFAGKPLAIYFSLMGKEFVAINAGDEFTPNPSISFFITLDSKEEIDELWGKLADGGKGLMPLAKYPFSEYYGWVQDKYNVSWQLILNDPAGEERPKVMPSLLFTQDKSGKAKEARDFYLSVFKNSKEGVTAFFEEDTQVGQKKGDVMFSDFMLENVWLAAMDGGNPHEFTFNEGVSFNISCKDQAEIDYFWDKLTSNGGAESVCGWCKDKYGLSWQVNPENIEALMVQPGAWEKLLQMKKIDIKALEGV